ECTIGDSCVVHRHCRECRCPRGRAMCDREHHKPPHCSCHIH
uniref:Perlinhibin n=1 Tax=Haliotis laevigata TaxID=36097 RepID=PLINH_HALLA|nr:RecName: Full=Perlinhibin [Haliotis laevigata]